MATVPGIDVSYWNAGIDWPKVRATGQRYVFAKATEGDYYSDTTFDNNWFGAKSAGLLRGAYHFYRCNVDAKKQADYFIFISVLTVIQQFCQAAHAGKASIAAAGAGRQ